MLSSLSPHTHPPQHAAGLAVGLAAALPAMLALALPPSPALAQQCAAFVLWGAVAAALAPGWPGRSTWPLMAALALLAAAALGSVLLGAWPASLALLALSAMAAAGLLSAAGSAAAGRGQAVALFTAVAWGLLAAGIFNAVVAVVQVWQPQLADGLWIARSDLPGRAIGNFRQSNHLASLLLWSLAAAGALHALRRLPRLAMWAVAMPLVLALELSASRFGAAGLLLLAAWGAIDRRLASGARWMLLSLPLLFGLAWAGVSLPGDAAQAAVGAGARLSEGADSPNTRWNIWRTAWSLAMAQPWSGVGFGEFNLAWTLSAFRDRPTAFFDHAHNLPLHLAAELGLPLALLVLALLGWALWRAWRAARTAAGEAATVCRAALVMLLLMAGHSLVEYPLWYAYFLLPTAWLWGLLLGAASAGSEPAQAHRDTPAQTPAQLQRRLPGLLAGLLVSLGGLAAWFDYRHVVNIYLPDASGQPLAARIQTAQRSLLFAHMADHAAVVNPTTLASRQLGLTRAPHALTDPAVLVAWSQYMAAAGDIERARWLAQRLRDFRHPGSEAFLAVCGQPGAVAFQCTAPTRGHDWREFLALPPLAAGAARPAAPAASAN